MPDLPPNLESWPGDEARTEVNGEDENDGRLLGDSGGNPFFEHVCTLIKQR